MRILKSLLSVVLAAIPVMSASALEVTLNVPANAEHLKCDIAYSPTDITFVNGVNTVEAESGAPISFYGESPYIVSAVVDKNGTSQSVYAGKCTVYASEEAEYTVSLKTLEESRTSSFTLNVDDPAKVSFTLQGYYAAIHPEAGSNTVKFDPNIEYALMVEPVSGSSIYQVKLDGVAIQGYGSRWNVRLTDGAVVDVITDFPDVDNTLTFTYSDKGKGCIASVLVNGVKADEFDGEALVVKAGAKIELVPNPDFNITYSSMNGNSLNWFGGQTYSNVPAITSDATFYFQATPIEKKTITVTVNKPEFLNFYIGTSSYGNTPVELVEGDNDIKVNDNVYGLCWEYVGDSYAKSITIDGIDYTSSKNTYSVTDGMKIVFDLAEIVLDQKAVVWMDNRSMINTYFQLNNKNNAVTAINTGYNEIVFSESMSPYMLYWYEPTLPVAEVYLNDELCSDANGNTGAGGSHAFNLPLADLDVVKIFVEEAPVECVVAFSLNEGAEVNVVRDLIVPVEDLDEDLNCFKGTQVAISPADPKDSLNVHVNETKIEPNDAGEYVFTVDQPDNVVKVESLAAGVVAISSEAAANAVYDLAGRKINADLNNLPAGLYIVNGKKVIK